MSQVMESNVIPLLCHFDGQLIVENGIANYLGGRTKMIWTNHNISFRDLIGYVCTMGGWENNSIPIKLKYQVQVGRSFAFVDVENDDDVQRMLRWYPHMINIFLIYVERLDISQSLLTETR
jgi:hypothetical protein